MVSLFVLARHADHALLQRGHRGVADFDREIAARHHDAVAGRHDVLQRAGRHRFGAFDLGDQEGFAAGGAQQLPRHVHIRARFRKRHREKIHLDRGGGADVVHVLGRERRRGQPAAAAVDALVVRQHPAVVHAAVHPVALDPFHLEFDAAIVEQQHVARAHVARQFLIVQTDALLIAELAIGVENESVPRLERDFAAAELADADLRALQIAHDAHRAAGLAADLAHHRGALQVVLGGAVGEIEAHYVHPCLEHALQGFGVVRRGPEGRDDFGAASHLGIDPFLIARTPRKLNGASSLASACDTLCRAPHFPSAAPTAIPAQPRFICSADLRWAVASAGCNRARRWRGPRPVAAYRARRDCSASPGNRRERRRRGSRGGAGR